MPSIASKEDFAKYLDGATRRRGAQATRGRLSSPMKKTSWNGPPEEDDSGSASRHVKTRSEEDEAKWSLEEDDSGTILQVAFRRHVVSRRGWKRAAEPEECGLSSPRLATERCVLHGAI